MNNVYFLVIFQAKHVLIHSHYWKLTLFYFLFYYFWGPLSCWADTAKHLKKSVFFPLNWFKQQLPKLWKMENNSTCMHFSIKRCEWCPQTLRLCTGSFYITNPHGETTLLCKHWSLIHGGERSYFQINMTKGRIHRCNFITHVISTGPGICSSCLPNISSRGWKNRKPMRGAAYVRNCRDEPHAENLRPPTCHEDRTRL